MYNDYSQVLSHRCDTDKDDDFLVASNVLLLVSFSHDWNIKFIWLSKQFIPITIFLADVSSPDIWFIPDFLISLAFWIDFCHFIIINFQVHCYCDKVSFILKNNVSTLCSNSLASSNRQQYSKWLQHSFVK